MDKQLIRYYLEQQLAGKLTAGEREALLQMEAGPERDALIAEIERQMTAAARDPVFHPESVELQQFQQIINVDKPGELISPEPDKNYSPSFAPDKVPARPATGNLPATIKRVHFLKSAWLRFTAAATIVVTLGVAIYLRETVRDKPVLTQTTKRTAVQEDVAPGGDKAVLTLANGSVIVLDSAFTGQLALEGGSLIQKTSDGQVIYIPKEAPTDEQEVYNTISTPRGGQYQIALPDGSRVWLNAESSLRFPAFFKGQKRVVELTGEGYFEVARNPSKPFYVNVGKMSVQVLGTNFNINSYKEESSIKTTLLEGVVTVSSEDRKKIDLKPGQQAQVTDENTEVVENPDLEEVMAWKNGLFIFRDASIESIMRQIGRWYDMEIVYEKSVPKKELRGKASRATHLSSLLKVLELNGVPFKVEGKKIIIGS